MFFAVDAKAACTPMPTCEELNYTDTKCDGEFITCPFDETKIKCLSSNVDCAQMGFTQDNKSTWCGKEISCPTDPKYTACVEAYENPCPNGYDNRYASVEDCGEQGSNGWTFTSTTITGNNGQNILCGKCTPKSCPGFSRTYQTADSCGGTNGSGSAGWNYRSCYEGDEKLGYCEAKTCSSHGLHDPSELNNGMLLCKETATKVYLGNASSSCYSCVSCGKAEQYSSSEYSTWFYMNQSGIDKCRHGSTKLSGLYGCYRASLYNVSVFSYKENGITYKGRCDSCWPVDGAGVAAYPEGGYFCCKNGEFSTNTRYDGTKYSCP